MTSQLFGQQKYYQVNLMNLVDVEEGHSLPREYSIHWNIPQNHYRLKLQPLMAKRAVASEKALEAIHR